MQDIDSDLYAFSLSLLAGSCITSCIRHIFHWFQFSLVFYFSGFEVWDLRRNDLAYVMRGHTDTVTGLSLSPEGTHVLSNAMDCSGQPFFLHCCVLSRSCMLLEH